MNCGIYCIRNLINGKVYIGSTTSFKRRQYEHWRELRRGISKCLLLQRAWDKYGADAFAFAVLEQCEPGALLEREDWWIENLGALDREKGYNIGLAVRGRTGLQHSAETKAKIGAANSGRSPSAETRAKMSAAKLADPNRGQYAKGHVVSEEQRRKHAEKIRQLHQEGRYQFLVGRPKSEETKTKMSLARKGKPNLALRGRVISAEQRAKISAANKGRCPTEEQREKMRAAHRRRAEQRPAGF